MDIGRISGRYAKAAYEAAVEKGDHQALYKDMKTLTDNFFAFKTLKQVLENPVVSSKDKIELLTTAAGVKVSETYQSLLQLLVKNRRESMAQSVGLMYIKLYREQQGIVMAHLTMPDEASEETKDKLKELIARHDKRQVEFTTEVDTSLIGGFVLRLDDYQIDASIKTQLELIKNQLINTK